MQESPQDFEKLRQLLALKRRESPPPGYFRDFSGRVLNQIERDGASPGGDWFKWLASLFQTRPAISWSFCMASCLVIFAASSTLFESDPGNPATATPSVHAVATLSDQASAAPASGAFLVTNLEARQFALEMAPPPYAATASNSLFSQPFYLRLDNRPEFRGEQIPAKYESFVKP